MRTLTTAPQKTLAPNEFARMLDELERRTSRELAETRARFHKHRAQNSDVSVLDAAFAA